MTQPAVRLAEAGDVDAVCRFGAALIEPHYTPLIGATAAADQVRHWWNESQIRAAVNGGLLVVAELDGRIVGVGQRGVWDGAHVIWKLYVDPALRGSGLGPRLIAALERDLPADATRLYLEHFAANERAGAFYEREGFRVDRIEPHPSGDPRLATVWRVRPLDPLFGRKYGPDSGRNRGSTGRQ